MSQGAVVSDERNLPWVEKYRPEKLGDLISQQEIIATLTKFVNENKLPHLLFYGPPGTGKTTTILAVSKLMYSPKELQSMILELNASDDRGIDIVRDRIMSFAQTRTLHFSANTNVRPKLIILDEADAMTKDAQSALRRVIEKFTENVRFCIICNYLSKLVPAIQSRCTRFRFAPLLIPQMQPRLKFIVDSERLDVTKDGFGALLKLAEGDMRRAINILQSTAMAFKTVSEKTVYQCVGQPLPSEIDAIIRILLNDTVQDAYTKIEKVRIVHGFALSDILRAMHDIIFRLDIPPRIITMIIDKMAQIEYRLAQGCSDRLQLGSLIGIFTEARATLAKIAPAVAIDSD